MENVSIHTSNLCAILVSFVPTVITTIADQVKVKLEGKFSGIKKKVKVKQRNWPSFLPISCYATGSFSGVFLLSFNSVLEMN